MAVNPDKNGVEQSLIARLIGRVKRIALDMGDSVSAETSRAQAAEGLKADKVQGATAGNLAALDANGNITDSGSKAADFKTKQTPVASPDPSGNNGLNFIDSVSQNENGEVVLHKNTVQSASTTYKGVVQLSNAIDSTSQTEAATPKAIKDAYDELNNKIVARAVFLSQAEWAVQSQLPGDPAKVYYVEDGTGEDAYTVYVWKESTSTYEEVDESSIDLDGYWHDGPTTTGSGNVVTNITLGNDGVPQIEKGLTALTQHQDISGKQNVISTDTDSSAFGDDTAIATGFSSDKLHLNVASRLWNYIRGKILGWYDWTRVDSGTGRYAKICSIADPASGTSYTVDVLVTHMTSYYAVTGLVRITVSHGSSSVQASILASDSLFYAVDSGNPPKVYTYVDSNGKRTFVFDTASAYQTAQGFVFRAVGGFSDKWSFFGDVGCSNDAADLGSIGTKQDALDVTFVFATYAKTAGHAATASSADSATSATNADYAYQAGNAATVNSHTVDKDVPSNAVFTDTTYNQISRGSGAGLAPGLPSGSGTSKYLREDGTWYTPPHDTYSAGDGLTLSEFNQFSVDNPFNPNGDYSSNTLRANTAVSADYAASAGNASTVNNHSVNKDVPSNAVFTDTWKANSFSSEGYVKKGEGNYDCVWGTNSNGAPDWQVLANLSVGYANNATSAENYSSGGGIDNALQGKAPKLHIDTQGIYGLAKEGYYGHVKLAKGNISGRAYSDGEAASVGHNHDGSYLKNPQSHTLQWGGTSVIGTYSGNNITLTMPANPFNPNGDYSSNTLRANTAVSADSAQYATGASNYTTDGNIYSRFSTIDSAISTIKAFGLNGIFGKILTFNGTAAGFDFDSQKTAGIHIFNLNAGVSGGPASGHQVLIVLTNTAASRVWQISLAYGLLARKWNGSSWSSWKTILSNF